MEDAFWVRPAVTPLRETEAGERKWLVRNSVGMDSQRRRRVSLTGDVAGDYVVVEERGDGSLVLEPDSSRRPAGAAGRPASQVGSLFSGLLSSPKKARMSVAEILEDWGVELRDDEQIGEFFVGDVDDRAGFIALTSQRFIFIAHADGAHRVVQEHLLSAARNVELVRRGLRHKLRVTWHGADHLIAVPDRKALERLHQHLEGRGSA